MAISKQTIEIAQPIYDTIDKAFLSADEKSYETSSIRYTL